MDNRNQTGFTLIELLVTLAVAAILLGVGIPSFSGAIKNSRVSADYNEITQALFLARSEAVKSNNEVTVCAKSAIDATTCGDDVSDWENGWLVFIDVTNNALETDATIDNTDEIIAIHPEPKSDNELLAEGSIDRTFNTSTKRTYIRYNQRGQSNWANGSFYLCDFDEPTRSRVVNVAPTGDVRPGRTSGSDYPRDVYTRESCTP